MSARYWLSTAAEQSLDDIFNYTYDRWGEDQARVYVGAFFTLFAAISNGDEKGRLIQAEYGVSGFFARCGKHYVYWKNWPTGALPLQKSCTRR